MLGYHYEVVHVNQSLIGLRQVRGVNGEVE